MCPALLSRITGSVCRLQGEGFGFFTQMECHMLGWQCFEPHEGMHKPGLCCWEKASAAALVAFGGYEEFLSSSSSVWFLLLQVIQVCVEFHCCKPPALVRRCVSVIINCLLTISSVPGQQVPGCSSIFSSQF